MNGVATAVGVSRELIHRIVQGTENIGRFMRPRLVEYLKGKAT
jgi:plasmid maintenance system antidote protein VapI